MWNRPVRANKSIRILILGMHRSGTSSLAGSLQACGLYLGPVFEHNPNNIKGNRENIEIIQINDAILACNGGRWDAPPDPIRWTRRHESARKRILQTFIASNQPIWGFKDPRILLTLNFWLEGPQDLCQIKMVGMFRRPEAVAGSLLKRNGIPLSNGIKLWEQYNSRLYNILQEATIPLACFDTPTAEYLSTIDRIAHELQLEQTHHTRNEFFDDALRHEHGKLIKVNSPPSARKLYDALSARCNSQHIFQ
jgi:hypothetical protein